MPPVRRAAKPSTLSANRLAGMAAVLGGLFAAGCSGTAAEAPALLPGPAVAASAGPQAEWVETRMFPLQAEDRFEQRSGATYYFETRGGPPPTDAHPLGCPTAGSEGVDLYNCSFDRYVQTVYRVTPGRYSVSPNAISQDSGYDQPVARTVVSVHGPNSAPYDILEFPSASQTNIIAITEAWNTVTITTRYTDNPFKRRGYVHAGSLTPLAGP